MNLLHKLRVYRISNTPGTKLMKFGLKCSNLHFKKNKTIKFEPTWDWLEPSLESLQRIHVNSKIWCFWYLHILVEIFEFCCPIFLWFCPLRLVMIKYYSVDGANHFEPHYYIIEWPSISRRLNFDQFHTFPTFWAYFKILLL